MSSLRAFMASWLTPTSLFVFINLTIFTIFLISYFGSQRNPQQKLTRTGSLLDRVRSFNLSFYNFDQHNTESVTEFFQPEHADQNPGHHPTQPARSPSLLARLKSINLSSLYRSDSSVVETEPGNETPDPGQGPDCVVRRSKSDKNVGAPERPREKMKKSVSEKSGMEENGKATTSLGCDEEVDAKADDFINRFKQQLRLQRIDSLLRYRELLKRN